MGTKANPSKYDCYEKLQLNEPYFVVMARDASAPFVVRQWAAAREQLIKQGLKPESDRQMVAEARECAAAMERYRNAQLEEQRKQASQVKK